MWDSQCPSRNVVLNINESTCAHVNWSRDQSNCFWTRTYSIQWSTHLCESEVAGNDSFRIVIDSPTLKRRSRTRNRSTLLSTNLFEEPLRTLLSEYCWVWMVSISTNILTGRGAMWWRGWLRSWRRSWDDGAHLRVHQEPHQFTAQQPPQRTWENLHYLFR